MIDPQRSPIKDVIQAVMDEVVVVSGDTGRNQAPYFRYGHRWYATNEGRPPQVRWRATSFATLRSNCPKDPFEPASLDFVVEGLIWGSDEQECIDHYACIAKAIQNVGKSKAIMPAAQPPIIAGDQAPGITGEFQNVQDRAADGCLLSLEWMVSIPLTVPAYFTGSRLVTTASFGVTSSIPPDTELQPVMNTIAVLSSSL